jgi:hypothetical protein
VVIVGSPVPGYRFVLHPKAATASAIDAAAKKLFIAILRIRPPYVSQVCTYFEQ